MIECFHAAAQGFEEERQIAVAAADVEDGAGAGQRDEITPLFAQHRNQYGKDSEGTVRIPVEFGRALRGFDLVQAVAEELGGGGDGADIARRSQLANPASETASRRS